MVEDLTDVSSVEVKVSMAEMDEGDPSNEKDEPGVVSLSRGLERIVTDLVTVGQVVDVVLLLPGVAAGVRRERMHVAKT